MIYSNDLNKVLNCQIKILSTIFFNKNKYVLFIIKEVHILKIKNLFGFIKLKT